MDSNTGKIKIFENMEAARAAGYTVKLNEDQTKEMLKISEGVRINLIKHKQKQKLINKSIKLKRQKLRADRKNERSRRNRH